MTTLQEQFGFTQQPFPRVPPEEAILHHKGLEEVLARLHFALERDTIALLVGESGCGKSTALSLFAKSLEAFDLPTGGALASPPSARSALSPTWPSPWA